MEFALNRPQLRGLMTPTGTVTRRSLFILAYIALGGLLGTLARYGLQGWLQQGRAAAPVFPVGTLAVNIVGSLVLGFLMRYATGSTVLSPEMRGALTVGFCGAFTTMSSFSYETMTLVGDGQYWRAALYLGGTIIGCLAAVVAGTAAANRLL